ncbi:MAG: cupin domain-containing protein [Patescibacteria group bacterium]|nr:cupin domain-containing protein [Patescibacteria group bacterium]
MNKDKVLKELKEKFPGKNIILNNEANPTEIVCEIDPENGKAIAVIDESIPHYHNKTREYYIILDGNLELFVDNVKHSLAKDNTFEIDPRQKHYAIGKETWVEVTSVPPWKIEDHIIEEKK